jgi:hypothetical protein
LQHHATWSVNSICHMYGDEPFDIEDESKNNWAVAMVAMGEGWHHNHHAFPTSAKHGLTGRQIDPSYYIIKGLEAAGLAWDLKQPSPEAVQKKLRVAPTGQSDGLASDTNGFAPQRNHGPNKPVPESAIPDADDAAARAASPLARANEGTSDRQAVA